MKSERYTLVNEAVKVNCCTRIKDMVADGKVQVVISNASSKTARQNSLMWLWHTFVANSGMGSYDTKEAVHRAVKQRWVLPILIRDDEFFSDLYLLYKQLWHGDTERMNWFYDDQVSTLKLSSQQMAEVLTDYQRFYAGHGILLPDPDDLKLLAYEGL